MFEGGAGELRPGRPERSIERGDRDLFAEREPGECVTEVGGAVRRLSVTRGGSCVATDIVSV